MDVNPKIPVNLSQEFSPLVLLWQGSNLDKQWLEFIRPQTAIVSPPISPVMPEIN